MDIHDAFVRESIVKPNVYVPSGFESGVTPQSYGHSLSGSELANLVAFVTHTTGYASGTRGRRAEHLDRNEKHERRRFGTGRSSRSICG